MHHTISRTLLSLLAVVSTTVTLAQQNDTLRRKDPNGWDFIQVRSYNVVIAEGYLNKGVREGVWNEYYPTVVPSSVTTYLHGKKDGLAMKITAAGMVEVVEHYKNDKLEGPYRMYNSEGMGLLEESFYSEGKKHGGYTKWYKNGQKQETGVFTNGVREGKSIWYFETGAIAAEYNYSNGEIDGDVTTYYPNSKPSAYGKYKKGIQTGPWKEYHENGNIKAEGNYANGEKDGEWKNYDDKGNFTKNTKYVKGELK